jgi:hypothetical protein
VLLHRDPDGGVTCIGQAAHAWVSGRLARQWGNDRFAPPEPFEEVCLGVEQHDVGMAEWDVDPALNPETGLPSTFMEMPLETHLELWSRAPYKVLTQSPYAALLVSMHGHALYARRPQTDPIARFVAEQEALQEDILGKLAEDPARARRNQKLVWALDFLSLAPIMRWVPESVPSPEGPLAVAERAPLELTVDPWPFAAGELTLDYPGRRLEGRFETQDDLRAALGAARWVTVSAKLRPAG